MSLQFKHNAADVLTRAWSIRWMVAAFVFTVLETAAPFFEGWHGIPPHTFGIISGVCTALAFVSRLMVQRNLTE